MKNKLRYGERSILSIYDYRDTRTKIVFGLIILLITIMVASMLYPIFVAIFNGLKTNAAVNSFPPTFLPDGWQWENYRKGWEFFNLPLFLRNTLLIFVGNMVVTVIVSGFAAFSLSHLHVPYRKAVTSFFLMTLFIPPKRDIEARQSEGKYFIPPQFNYFDSNSAYGRQVQAIFDQYDNVYSYDPASSALLDGKPEAQYNTQEFYSVMTNVIQKVFSMEDVDLKAELEEVADIVQRDHFDRIVVE